MKKQIIQRMLCLKEKEGEELFSQHKRLMAFLKDYFPYAKHEHYLIRTSLPFNFYELFKSLPHERFIHERSKSIGYLEQNAMMAHQWAEEAVDFWMDLVEEEMGYESILGEGYLLSEPLQEDVSSEMSLTYESEASLSSILHKANCYYNGEGIREDRKEALKWYEKAAYLGSIEAMNYVGNIYYMGEAVPRDEALAFKWYKKAADLGSSIAMNYIGNMYYEGRCVPLSFQKAHYWYNKAIAKGNFSAMFNLGYIYYEQHMKRQGVSFEMDLQAAEEGNIEAMYHIAYSYHWGEGTDQDYKAAKQWYEVLAKKGEKAAMIWIAYMYFNGQGVKKNLTEARNWCEKAIKLQ